MILQNEKGEFLLEQRPSRGLLANLWQFPLIEVETIISDGTWKSFNPVVLDQLDEEQQNFIKQYVKEKYQLNSAIIPQSKGVIEHIFSHLKWEVSIFEGKAVEREEFISLPKNTRWVQEKDFEDFTFPTVQKKIWKSFTELTLF